jgi:hypothetical protein
VRAPLKSANETRRTPAPVREAVTATAVPATPADAVSKPSGYGLPCAKCKTYYLASLSACPICKSTERASPVIVPPQREASSGQRPAPPDVLQQKQESFLRQFNAKLGTTQNRPAAPSRCTFAADHDPAHKPAEVCRTCYEDLQERVDLFEAALHIDLNEAAQVIYEAVWADTSDSNKTYLNAARALLGELRKRAGLNVVLGSLQPLTH